MVLATIEESHARPPQAPPLHVQTRFTPKSTRPGNNNVFPPYSTRNIANATEPLSTTSIVFSMKQPNNKNEKQKQMFFSQDDSASVSSHPNQGEGFSDIFRKWEDESSIKSSSGSVTSQRTVNGRGANNNFLSNKKSEHGHRRAQTASAIPKMDDWMNIKLDMYEHLKNEVKKMELTPPPRKATNNIEVNKAITTLPLQGRTQTDQEKRLQHLREKRSSGTYHEVQQRDDMEQDSRTGTNKMNIMEEHKAKMDYYRALDQNELLQKQLEYKSHEIASLQHRLEDMEQWYHSRLEDLGSEHREAEKMCNKKLQLEREAHKDDEMAWFEERKRMEKQITTLTHEVREAKMEAVEIQTTKQMLEATQDDNLRLNDELRGCRVEIEKLAKENESMDRDLTYQRSERERLETMHQSRLSEITEERQRDKEQHQSLISSLMNEKERAFQETAECRMRIQSITKELEEKQQKAKENAFHEANEWKMRQKDIHDAMIVKLKEEHEYERECAYHEVNDLKARIQSENERLHAMKRELDEEATRNAAITKDKNAMADMLDKSVTKMEQMQKHIMELEKSKVNLMMTNSELEAENTRFTMLAREKSALEGTMNEYHAKMSELELKNQELERETMSLKQELIDVLEVASHYQ